MTRTELKAFSEGYDTALFREKEVILESHNRDYEAAWVRGYKRGLDTISFHKRLLTRRSTFDFFNNLYGKRGGSLL